MWKDFPGSEHLGYVSDSMSHRSVPGGLKDRVALTSWTNAPHPGSLDPAPAPPAISASSGSREAPSSRPWSQNLCIFGLLFPFCHPRSPSSPSAQPLKYLQNPTTSPHLPPGWTIMTSSRTFPVASSTGLQASAFTPYNSFSTQQPKFQE